MIHFIFRASRYAHSLLSIFIAFLIMKNSGWKQYYCFNLFSSLCVSRIHCLDSVIISFSAFQTGIYILIFSAYKMCDWFMHSCPLTILVTTYLSMFFNELKRRELAFLSNYIMYVPFCQFSAAVNVKGIYLFLIQI